LPAQSFNGSADAAHPLANATAVGLQFLLARTAGSDTTAEPGKLRSGPSEPRQKIIQLGQLDLQLSLAAARVPREDVQDELGAINNATVRPALQIALLHGRELAVKDNQGRLACGGFGADLLQLASSNDARGINSVAHLKNAAGDNCSRAARQFSEFLK
jgi:hypothetical protein